MKKNKTKFRRLKNRLCRRKISMSNKDLCFAWFIGEDPTKDLSRQALALAHKWNSGDTISISFLDGDNSLQQKVKQYAREWTAPGGANLGLGFRHDTNNTMIRISFLFGSENWSLVGTDCKNRTDITFPTMNLNLNSDSPEDEIKRKVRHEFGHALGMIHEHQIPDNGIKWNESEVINDLSGPPNDWTVTEIKDNVLVPAKKAETNSIAFDPESIMIYPIPPNWTQDGFTVGWNNEISQKDKNFIRSVYP